MAEHEDVQAARPKTPRTTWDDIAEVFIAASDYLDPENPRASFEQYLQDRADDHPEIGYYLTHGSWRESSQHATKHHGDLTEATADLRPNSCYYNAQTTLTPNRKYVEGYVITDGRIPAPHAWIEVDQNVVEITPPWRDKRVDDLEYYGVAFDNAIVRESMVSREVADPIVEMVLEGSHAE